MIARNLGKIVLFLLFPIFLFADIEFTQRISKQKALLNETVKVVLELKVPNDLNIDQISFDRYETFDFWIEELTSKNIIKTLNETIYIYEYLLDAKDIGEFTLPTQTIEITSQEIRNFRKWKKIYSNKEDITILPLIENQAIQGEYEIASNANKTKIKANESINLSLNIKGKGNIKDINPFDLSLDEQTIYKDKAIINKEFLEDSYEGEFIQNFLIIADKSFTIPSFSFEYFDTNKKAVKKISTEPIYIEVEEVAIFEKEDLSLKYIFALVGFFLGLVVFSLYKYLNKYYKKVNSPLFINIKKAKSDKELYELLIKHSSTLDVKDTIKLLEENIYSNKKNKINKKELFKLLDESK